MAGDGGDGLVEDTSSLGDRIIGFIVNYAFVEFLVCAFILLSASLYILILCNNRRSQRDHRPAEDLPVSSNANIFIVVPTSAAVPSTASIPVDEALDRSVLASMPTFVYSSSTELRRLIEPCAICSKGFEDGEKGRLLRPCFHVFHVGYSDEWFRSHSTCRVCGAVVGALDV